MTNSKHTKRALLSSVLALLLCFTMLLGTTFAWFTDNASTGVNKIQAGKLDVVLEMEKDGKWVSAEGETLDFVAKDGNKNILWEPGCTYDLPKLRIRNNGNLALKYKVEITGIKGDAKLNEAIEWTINGADVGTEYHLAKGAEAELTISGHMKEQAGNEYQGLSIDGVAITVYATQDTVEYDSTTNEYDKDAEYLITWDGKTMTAPSKDDEGVYHITNAAEFAEYITTLNCGEASKYSSAHIVLENNIDLGGHTFTVSGEGYSFEGIFDGQGYSVSNYTIKRTDNEMYTGLFSVYLDTLDSNVATIKNLTVKNGTVIGGAQTAAIVPAVYVGGLVDNCHAINCTVIGEKKVGAVTGYVQTNGTVSNCSASGCNIYASDSREDQATLFGFDNGGTFTNNTDKGNNTVKTGATNVSVISDGVVLNNGVYEISNAQGLVYCAKTFNNGAKTNNKKFELTSDIDMSGIEWTPWCNEKQYFNGNFNGNGHTISNLTIVDDHTADDGHAVGFIGRLGGGGADHQGNKTIENVTFDNAAVSGHQYVGVVVGYNEYGTMDNVKVTNSSVTATHVNKDGSCGDKAGAVVGMCAPNISVSVTNCSAINCTVTAARDAAQLIGYGYANNTFTNLSATNVTVTAAKGACNHERAGVVSANALVGNGTVEGLALN